MFANLKTRNELFDEHVVSTEVKKESEFPHNVALFSECLTRFMKINGSYEICKKYGRSQKLFTIYTDIVANQKTLHTTPFFNPRSIKQLECLVSFTPEEWATIEGELFARGFRVEEIDDGLETCCGCWFAGGITRIKIY